jgi:hypothetical protein
MDPSRPHPLFEAISSLFSSPDRIDRKVAVEDAELELRYDPEPGVDYRIRGSDAATPAHRAEATGFQAAEERPETYPPGLPYLPGHKVSVQALPGSRGAVVATWWIEGAADGILAEILAQSAASGWAHDPDGDASPIPSVRMLTFRRPDRQRVITVSDLGERASIQLIDGRPEA